MKKTFSLNIILLMMIASFGIPQNARSQELGFGGGLSWMVMGSETGTISSYGLGGRLRINGETMWGALVGAYYFLPSTSTTKISIPDINNSGVLRDFDNTGKFSLIHIYLHLNYYFAGAPVDEFGMYSYGGIGYLVENAKLNVENCDPQVYNCAQYNISDTYTGTTADIGFGLNIPITTFYMYLEAGYNFPAAEIFGDGNEPIKINASFAINGGVIIPF